MASNQVLWLESFSEEEVTVKQKNSFGLKVQFHEEPFQDLSEDKFSEDMILTTRTHSNIPVRYHDQIQCLITRSTGYDHISGTELIDADFPIGYLPDYATKAVAEHNLMTAMALIRKLNRSQDAVKKFNRDALTGFEIASLKAGVVGVGRIGRKTVELLSALGVQEIFGFDKSKKKDWRSDLNFSYQSLQTVFRESNLIFLCLPFNENTNQMINETLLREMPDPAFLINTGRGEVVSSRILLEALKEGSVDGLGLDVFNRESELSESLRRRQENKDDPEEIRAGKELIDHPDVIATPHNAFNTHSALDRKVTRTLKNIKTFLDSGAVIDSVRDQIQ